MQFLDLEIFKQGEQLHTRTYFKDTDCNGYIPYSSRHHPQWKQAIPKGQLIRIKRNCNLMEDYNSQTDTLIKRFVDKGYERTKLERTRDEIGAVNREIILKEKTRQQTEE